MAIKLFIFGTGTIADVAFHYFSNDAKFKVVGFVEYKKFLKKRKKNNLPVIEFEKIKKVFPKKEFQGFVAVGYKSMNAYREKIFKSLKKLGYKLPSYISKNSIIAKNVKIGENCFIQENQVIQTHVKIGNNVTLWCGNIIGHHNTIKDHCFITSNVVIAGNCIIGKNTFIGIKTAIKEGIKIGDNCAILMNSTIAKNMKKNQTSLSNVSTILDYKHAKELRNKYFK